MKKVPYHSINSSTITAPFCTVKLVPFTPNAHACSVLCLNEILITTYCLHVILSHQHFVSFPAFCLLRILINISVVPSISSIDNYAKGPVPFAGIFVVRQKCKLTKCFCTFDSTKFETT